MATEDRLGVNGVWLKGWKRDCANLTRWWNDTNPDSIRCLEHYALSGASLTPAPVSPGGSKRWLYWLDGELSNRAKLDSFEVEKQGMSDSSYNGALAVRAFAAMYTSGFISLHTHHLAAAKGRPLRLLRSDRILFTALGVVLGCHDQACRLARLQMTALRKGWYDLSRPFPIAHLVLRILADYLSESAYTWVGGHQEDRSCNALYREWRSTDPESLIAPCLAVCDLHTHRCEVPFDKQATEFNNGEFARTPIEVLMVFKLRDALGLQNPKVDHPLMNSILGVLPEPVSFDSIACGPDNLVYRVRSKLAQDEYDETAIFTEIYGK